MRASGTHCASQHDILQGDFLENSLPMEHLKSRIDLMNYIIEIGLINLIFKVVFELRTYAIFASILFISMYEGPHNDRVRYLIIKKMTL